MIERYSRPAMKRVWADENKFHKWLQVEIAVCEAWAKLGTVPEKALPSIRKAKFDQAQFETALAETHHDVTAFLKVVAQSVGEESRFIHLGLTSSDVMDTALSLQSLEALDLLAQDVDEIVRVLKARAKEHKKTIMMGRTHGIHAEPTTLGLKLALWAEEMKRNADRISQARDVMGVGKISGAVGTYATVPPEVEQAACLLLKLKPAPVSNQIIQRDRHAQFVTTLAIVAASLEKFATEIRTLQRTEIGEVAEPFESGQTGSSAMPHKRNPELCERVCGLSRLIRGHSVTALENVTLWNERDISHSSAERLIIPDSCLALDYISSLFLYVVKGMDVYPDNMRRNLGLTQGVIFSQRLLLALIEKGLSRQKAYAIVQRNAMKALKERVPFISVLKNDAEVMAALRTEELDNILDYQYYLRYVDRIFERLGLS